MTPTPRNFFLCATPRSGSSFLSRLMAQTGLFGDLREHFHPFDLGQARRSMSLAPDTTSIEVMKQVMEAERSGEGLFSVKVMWEQLNMLMKTTDLGVGDLFPGLVCANLTREGTLRQAISLTKAKMQDRWHPGEDPEVIVEPPFDPWQIENELRVLEENGRCWAKFYEREGIEPLMMTFEQVVEDPRGVVGSLVDLCGLSYDTEELEVESEERPMSDGLNGRWEKAYRDLDQAGQQFEQDGGEVEVEGVRVGISVKDQVVFRPKTPGLVTVELTNQGKEIWPSEGGRIGKGRIAIEGQWIGVESKVYGSRSYVLDPPAPGEVREQKILLSSPAEVGEFALEFRLIQMGVGAIGDPLQVEATVHSGVTAEDEARIVDLFPDAELHADGWFWLEWLGYFRPAGGDWIVHQGLGWLIARWGPVPEEEGKKRGYNFWSEEHGWFWSAESCYPWINRFEQGGWFQLKG